MARLNTVPFANNKKLARFLLDVKTVKWECLWQVEQETLKVKVFTTVIGLTVDGHDD